MNDALGSGEGGKHESLASVVTSLLYSHGSNGADLGSKLELVEAERGPEVYAELIFLLSHLRFDPPEAKEHWEKVRQLGREMESRLEMPVDVRVALVNYFVGVQRELRNPKIIELRLFQETQASAYRDALTGLYNYRYFRERLHQEVERYDRCSSCLSLAMVDVDDFKLFNDRFGHETGNDVLARIAWLVADAVREVDTVARYGGEEFALILPCTEKSDAGLVAERVRRVIETTEYPSDDGEPVRLTVSIGVATHPADGRNADELVRNADSALYVAKSKGKNRVYLHGGDRRSFSRVAAAATGSIRVLTEETHDVETVNVSEGDVLFRTGRELPAGTLVEVQLRVGECEPVVCSGRIARVEAVDGGDFEAALRISEISVADRLRLHRYVRQKRE